ncbi:hypothetical protein [Actinomadura rupiterrae]|uniref:hypothetical protein n=1 Tax=Actinomadura rupiterrae TaxID=559627 RepID=UPI0020A260A4|nr:hypothetical protein [Actinomadura rupiterrae]MCP2336001.1 hypothetical protein [Actinomadura rupiterrae]
MGSSTVRRIAAAGGASGAVLIGSLAAGAAPALAAPAPGAPSVSIEPKRFAPGDDVTVHIDGCVTEPSVGDQNEIFVKGDPAHFDKSGGTSWSGIGATQPGLKPGNSYLTKFGCMTASGPRTLTLFATVPEKTTTPPPPPPGKGHGGDGGFHFGFDDVDLSTRTVMPGGTLGMKVHCPTEASASSSSFVEEPRFKETDKDSWEATATFEKSLPSIVRVTISCAGYRHVVFSTRPGKDEVAPGPQIPKGAPETGDGSTARRPADRTPLIGTGAAVVVLAGTGLALRRRATKGRS